MCLLYVCHDRIAYVTAVHLTTSVSRSAVLWSVKEEVDLLIADPFGSVAAAFVPVARGSPSSHCKSEGTVEDW